MEITLNVNYESFKSKLTKKVTFPRYFIFDITPGSTPEMLLEKLDDENYVFSYSRPFVPNIFKFQPCDYKFKFSFKKDKENLTIKGTIRFKTFVILSFAMMSLFAGFSFYSSFSRNDIGTGVSFIMIMGVFTLYLLIEYFVFKIKIRRFFNSIVD